MLAGSGPLTEFAARVRAHPGLRGKAALRMVGSILPGTDWLSQPGDDAAALPDGEGFLLAAGEAISPHLIAFSPSAAGIAAVVANVNDIAAMGGRPVALVDTVVGPEHACAEVLRGLRLACGVYGVPLVGGHLTVAEESLSVSAFAVGRARRLLAARHVAPGQTVLLAAALDGHLEPGFPLFSSFTERGGELGDDIGVLASLAESGEAVAAKDVSMAGILGSLAMLLEPTGSGATVDVTRIPTPPGVALEHWCLLFPTFAFLVCCAPDRVPACRAAFAARNLACEAIGEVDGTGLLRIRRGAEEATILDVRQGVTGLGGSL
ncbi:MAG TPA: AIR synthase related protein [Actinomycetota bacterium]|nr:AIR synthase related protein [Actinomycetota bacterium]